MTEVLFSQLAHVEIITPRPAESLEWYVNVLGLEETSREGQSVFLRGWGEDFHHSLQLTEGPAPALGHIGWRTRGPGDAELIAARVEPTGLGIGFDDGETGRGPAYRYHSPGGHVHEAFWEVEHWQAPPELATDHPDRPQRYTGRGVAVRYLDHVTVGSGCLSEDVAFYQTLGQRHTATSVVAQRDNMKVFATMTTNHSAHDLGIAMDPTGVPGRINHFAFWLDQREDVNRAAELLMDAGTPLEFGPGIHGIGEITYLYVREPGGMRVEINSGGYRNYQPDQQAHDWDGRWAVDHYRNGAPVHSMLECFPPVAEDIELAAPVVMGRI